MEAMRPFLVAGIFYVLMLLTRPKPHLDPLLHGLLEAGFSFAMGFATARLSNLPSPRGEEGQT
jgi:hypothetical protein